MDKNYQSHIAESKFEYHKNRAKMSFEDKVKVIVELQKIEAELNNLEKKELDYYEKNFYVEIKNKNGGFVNTEQHLGDNESGNI